MKLAIPYCGAPNGEAIPHSVRRHHPDVFLLGLDSNPSCDNSWLYDKFIPVPRTDSPDYRKTVEDLLHDVDWILPLNGRDAVELKKSELAEKVLATADYRQMERVMDKASLYRVLGEEYSESDKGGLIPTVKRYMSEYGSAVVKVSSGRGSRGVFIVGEFDDMKNRLYQKPGTLDMSFAVFEKMVNTTATRERFIVMPRFSGDEYFVNALCRRGEVLWLQIIKIHKKRDHVASVFEVVANDDLEERTRSICRRFRFDYWINLQFIGDHLIEVNPRISSWVAHPDYSVPFLAVRLAMGEDVSQLPGARHGTFGRRIFQMYYIYKDRVY